MRFRKPMGAKDYEGHEHQVKYPCYAQPKVDGIRCVTDGVRFWSKNGKLFPKQNLAHLQIERLPFLVDGELSLMGGHVDFEEIASVVKRVGHEDSRRILFNAFDCMTPEPYVGRKLALKGIFAKRQLLIGTNWRRLKTEYISDAKRLQRVHDYYLACGYEGTIVRSAFGLYVPKKTLDLLKWKPLHDDEFEIVGVKEARGKDAGTPIFICEAKGVGEFRVRPMGTMAQRRKMWRQRKRLIGKQLTVEYQNLTRYGIPRFPRAKVLRDYE